MGPALVPLGLAVALGWWAARPSRSVVFGRGGGWIAPPGLGLVWLVGVVLGQRLGSLTAMAWSGVGAVAIAAAGVGWRAHRLGRGSNRSGRWSALDRWSFGLVALFLVAYCGNDNLCHYSVVGAYLRGNIPPTMPNDPTRPLRYHPLIDAAAAVVADATGLAIESALDVVSIACVAGCWSLLQPVSRGLFARRRTRQLARWLYAFGFGPVYLADLGALPGRLLGTRPGPLGSFFLHGHTAQSFIQAIPRRPMGLNHLLFLLVLAVCLPRGDRRRRCRWGAHPAWLVVVGFLVPQASEDLTGLATGVVGWTWLAGSLRLRWLVAWAVSVALALPLSGVWGLAPRPSDASPIGRLAWSTPLALPYWINAYERPAGPDREADFALNRNGLPILTGRAAGVALFEWGPLFLAGVIGAAIVPRRRAIAWVVAVGLAIAVGLRLDGWVKADLDRFLFYGTSAGFLAAAGAIEWLDDRLRHARWSRRGRRVALAGLVLFASLGPVGFAARFIAPWALGKNSRLPIDLDETELISLRRDLAAVGPRDMVTTDPAMAQRLVSAGFVVHAPMAPGYAIGIVDLAHFAEANRTPGPVDPRWLFLPSGDPRLAGRAVVAEHGGYRLARTTAR